jgi:hypothetical protein
VHAGTGGFYYRATLPSSKPSQRPAAVLSGNVPILAAQHSDVVMHEIESGSVLDMVPESAAQLPDGTKRRQASPQGNPFGRSQ